MMQLLVFGLSRDTSCKTFLNTKLNYICIAQGEIGEGFFMEVKPTTKTVIKITRFHHQTMIKLGLFFS